MFLSCLLFNHSRLLFSSDLLAGDVDKAVAVLLAEGLHDAGRLVYVCIYIYIYIYTYIYTHTRL